MACPSRPSVRSGILPLFWVVLAAVLVKNVSGNSTTTTTTTTTDNLENDLVLSREALCTKAASADPSTRANLCWYVKKDLCLSSLIQATKLIVVCVYVFLVFLHADWFG